MMQPLEEIRNRRSVRKYKTDPVRDEDILQIMEAGRLAPSGSNTQPWRFLVVKEQATKEKIVQADHNQKWMLDAPVFLVCLAEIESRIADGKGVDLSEDSKVPELKMIIRDTAIAISYMLLEAERLGIGTCWTGWFEQEEMKKALNIPEHLYVCGVVTVGYADEKPAQRPRKGLDEIVRFEKW